MKIKHIIIKGMYVKMLVRALSLIKKNIYLSFFLICVFALIYLSYEKAVYAFWRVFDARVVIPDVHD